MTVRFDNSISYAPQGDGLVPFAVDYLTAATRWSEDTTVDCGDARKEEFYRERLLPFGERGIPPQVEDVTPTTTASALREKVCLHFD